ncbi:MAG: CapA family protein [Bacteroidales bacterium]|nr:CapA family protein [Bacteroidales bacterium]
MKSKIISFVLLMYCTLSGAQQHRWERISPVRGLWDKGDTVSVMIIGDVMMHARQLQYDCGPFLQGIKDRLETASLAVANMEFTLGGEPYSGYPSFSAPDSYAAYVKDCGIDVFLMANNHIMDKGTRGLERTLEVYRNMEGIRFTGAAADSAERARNHPLIVAVEGIRIAFVNCTYGVNGGYVPQWPCVNLQDTDDLSEAIASARRSKADFVVALPHWGEEYVLRHGASQQRLAQRLAEEGVDAVVGAHPHVVQDSCILSGPMGKKVPVFYSIGNAVSNMSAPNTRLELAVTLRFVKRPWADPEMLPPSVEFLWCTLPGKLIANYAVVPVREWMGRREQWMQSSDYDNMVSTYERVKSITGIQD